MNSINKVLEGLRNRRTLLESTPKQYPLIIKPGIKIGFVRHDGANTLTFNYSLAYSLSGDVVRIHTGKWPYQLDPAELTLEWTTSTFGDVVPLPLPEEAFLVEPNSLFPTGFLLFADHTFRKKLLSHVDLKAWEDLQARCLTPAGFWFDLNNPPQCLKMTLGTLGAGGWNWLRESSLEDITRVPLTTKHSNILCSYSELLQLAEDFKDELEQKTSTLGTEVQLEEGSDSFKLAIKADHVGFCTLSVSVYGVVEALGGDLTFNQYLTLPYSFKPPGSKGQIRNLDTLVSAFRRMVHDWSNYKPEDDSVDFTLESLR